GEVSGLNGAAGVAVSPDGRHVYATGELEDALAVFERDSASGALTFVEAQKDVLDGSLAGGKAGLRRLDRSHGLVLSPDGAHVYATGSLDNAVAVFTRDAGSGKLTFVEAQEEGQNGVVGLTRARAIAVSPDGANVYVAGGYDDALVVFARDAATGALKYLQLLEDSVNGINGLNGADDVAVSPDGTHVYVTASVDDALAVFARDAGS